MNTKDKIMKILKQKGTVKGTEVAKMLGISRQAVNKYLKRMIQEGLVVKQGVTRGAFFKLAEKDKDILKVFKKSYILKNIQEDMVFQEADACLNLRKNLRGNVFEIFNYVFTEILNNAIEHSFSKKCNIEINLLEYDVKFCIRDFGVGVFQSVSQKFGFPDEITAATTIIKGKITTLPERHTGEGIFFSSKSGDLMKFRSHKLNLIFDNIKDDIFIEEKRFIKGTEVVFQIGRYSRRNLGKIFDKFSPGEFKYKFERTQVKVKIYTRECISRSEAKRLLFGLDRFKEIILDFKGVNKIGQGFADEIFRVFALKNPDISIKVENISPVLRKMIEHVVDKKNNLKLTIS